MVNQPDVKRGNMVIQQSKVNDLCVFCNGPIGILGQLGNRLHLACRDCGQQYSRRSEVK